MLFFLEQITIVPPAAPLPNWTVFPFQIQRSSASEREGINSKWFEDAAPESQGQHPALTLLFVPSSLDNGMVEVMRLKSCRVVEM